MIASAWNPLVFIPEMMLTVTALSLLVAGAFNRENATPTLALAALGALVGSLVWLCFSGTPEVNEGPLAFDEFARFVKIVVVLTSGACVAMTLAYARHQSFARQEYPSLMLLAVVGLMVLVSATDLLTAFLAIELFAIASYVLAAINRDAERSTEAGLKLLLLGALASAICLFGISLVYGFAGGLSFSVIALAMASPSPGLLAGIGMVLAAIAFRLAIVPFHTWAPDVFEGAPTPVAAFLSAAPQVAVMAFLTRFATDAMMPEWQPVLAALAVLSMLFGAIAALQQRNIKRLLAYCAVSQWGLALLAITAGGEAGVAAAVVFMTIFAIAMTGVFACVLAMRRDDEGMVEEIDDVAGLMRVNPWMGMGFIVLLFSLAGLPPLLGFFGKYYVLLAAMDAGLLPLAAVAIVSSAMIAFALLRVVKIMMFDTFTDRLEPMAGELRIVLAVCAGLSVFFFWFWTPVLAAALAAAQSLF